MPHTAKKRQTLSDDIVGWVGATAIVAAIGNGAAFRKGREFAAWMGLVLQRVAMYPI